MAELLIIHGNRSAAARAMAKNSSLAERTIRTELGNHFPLSRVRQLLLQGMTHDKAIRVLLGERLKALQEENQNGTDK